MNYDFNKNEDDYKLLLRDLKATFSKVKLGGGEAKIQKQKAKGKLTARERIDYLVDDESFMEIGRFAAQGMYQDVGGCPSAGVITGLAQIDGKDCVIVANDSTVKAGAWFPMSGKKNLRAQEIAMENRLPIIYLVDSAGVFLPMQNEIFPDKEHFGRTFRNNAVMSAMGIVQIAAIMGNCVAGGAYLPMMSDESIIVEGGTIFLAGAHLVKSAIGEVVDNEFLGGASTHTEISGAVDNKFPNDESCLDYIKTMLSASSNALLSNFDRKKPIAPNSNPKDLYGLMPVDRTKPYDMTKILDCFIDKDSLVQYKEDYGKTLICANARIDGWSVGIIANQRQVVKNAQGERQMGGVIYGDSALKAARFIMNCNQRNIPLVFVQDVSGFMVGSKAEHGGIMKDGAKMVSAMANSTVPKFTILVGNSYGAGNYAMCGKAYDPRLIFAWPTAKMAVMSGEAASKTLFEISMLAAKKKGQEISEEEAKKQKDRIREKYNEELDPMYAAARLWTDDIIDPIDTRNRISRGIKIAQHAETKKFNPGILQT